MGGKSKYRLTVEFSREEIAKLFYAVHHGDTVQTFRSLLGRGGQTKKKRRNCNKKLPVSGERRLKSKSVNCWKR